LLQIAASLAAQMKHLFKLLAVGLVLVPVGSFLLLFRPWMTAGKAVHLGTWILESGDYQVWQRKNADLFEAFATALFVRIETNQWKAFLLDFEDTYAPRVELHGNAKSVDVIRNGKRLGSYDCLQRTFHRSSDHASMSFKLIQGKPPADWWAKNWQEP
jgi:hypothetical protein